jgi:alkylation response protein AidB-like acyl-CoA dehydrogenase
MFSEPEAGSDLANVATRAERDGDSWRLQGQKVWTSRGSYATWGLCLARTDPEVPKHAGMTMFAVRMDAPGVTVRPLVQMNGDRHFSEVFLDEVPVPDSDRIGDVDAGWTVALAVLAFERSEFGERGTGGDGRAGLRRVPGWLRELAELGALRDPVLRDRAMGIVSGELAARITALRASVSRSQGRPGPEGSGGKIRWSRLAKRRADLVKAAYGAHGMLTDHPGHLDALTAPSLSIRGGADEIQLNILGERVLGLAPEPRSDRQVPWTVSRRGGATQDG